MCLIQAVYSKAVHSFYNNMCVQCSGTNSTILQQFNSTNSSCKLYNFSHWTLTQTFHWFDFSSQSNAHFKLLIGYTTFWSWSIELEFHSATQPSTVLQAVSLHRTVILLMVVAVPALLYKVQHQYQMTLTETLIVRAQSLYQTPSAM